MKLHPEDNRISGVMADEAFNIDKLVARDPADLVPRLKALFELLHEGGVMPLKLTIQFANTEETFRDRPIVRMKKGKIHINGKHNPTAGIYDETIACSGCAFVGGIVDRTLVLPAEYKTNPPTTN